MASISGGMFRQSKNLKSSGKATADSAPLPPPVSSEQYNKLEMVSTYRDTQFPVNGAHSSKEEDHYGFLYSTSEKDFH